MTVQGDVAILGGLGREELDRARLWLTCHFLTSKLKSEIDVISQTHPRRWHSVSVYESALRLSLRNSTIGAKERGCGLSGNALSTPLFLVSSESFCVVKMKDPATRRPFESMLSTYRSLEKKGETTPVCFVPTILEPPRPALLTSCNTKPPIGSATDYHLCHIHHDDPARVIDRI